MDPALARAPSTTPAELDPAHLTRQLEAYRIRNLIAEERERLLAREHKLEQMAAQRSSTAAPAKQATEAAAGASAGSTSAPAAVALPAPPPPPPPPAAAASATAGETRCVDIGEYDDDCLYRVTIDNIVPPPAVAQNKAQVIRLLSTVLQSDIVDPLAPILNDALADYLPPRPNRHGERGRLTCRLASNRSTFDLIRVAATVPDKFVLNGHTLQITMAGDDAPAQHHRRGSALPAFSARGRGGAGGRH